jgi:putative colanic acid biosynthesis UDP-glucose lipid carrier transferase
MPATPLDGQLRQHGKDFARLQRILDLLAPAALFQLFNPDFNHQPLLLPSWVWVMGLTAVILPSAGLYSSFRSRSLFALARRVTRAWLLVLATLLLLIFATRTSASFSRLDSSLWALVSWLALLLTHVGLRRLLRWHRSRGGNTRSLLYWGTAENAADFQHQLLAAPWMGLRLVVWFSPVLMAPDDQPASLPRCAGGLLEMRRWLDDHMVDAIVFSHVPRNHLTMDQLLEFFGDTCLPVIYAPAWARSAMRFSPDLIGDIHCIDLWGGERSMIDRQSKRALDLLLASFGLLLVAPLLALIALAIGFTSTGPILFSQDRYGLDGRRFRILKFRTMRVVEAGDQPALRQATRDDPRITPLGRFLRRWSLDELPQLFNVIRGEMSLVGPRPHAVDHNEQYRRLIPGYMQRHTFKPGITGLAQVEGWRGETSDLQLMARRIDADLRYQRDWSLGLDIKILIKTILRLRSPQAY